MFDFLNINCNNDSHCRNETTKYEEFLLKISKFIRLHTDGKLPDMPILSAVNKDKIGYYKEAQNLYNVSNNLIYFIFTLVCIYLEKELRSLYAECDTNKCDDVEVLDDLYKKYELEKLMRSLVCKDYDYNTLRRFIENDLGWKLSISSQATNQGVNFECIIDENVENFNCDCNSTVLTVY